MAEIVQSKNSTILHSKKTSCHNSLALKVIVKSLVKLDKSSYRFIDLKNYLENILDEPVDFIVESKDSVSKKILTELNFSCSEMFFKDMLSLNKRSVLIIFIADEATDKAKKIIEIICNEKFHKSILLV